MLNVLQMLNRQNLNIITNSTSWCHHTAGNIQGGGDIRGTDIDGAGFVGCISGVGVIDDSIGGRISRV